MAAWLDAGAVRGSFREALRGLPDLERLAARVACARATPRDLGALRDTLARLPGLARGLAELAASTCRGARARSPCRRSCASGSRAALVDEPPPVARDGGVIRAGFDALRDELRRRSRTRASAGSPSSRPRERARTGIASLKVGLQPGVRLLPRGDARAPRQGARRTTSAARR